jgi:glutamate-ammonia-ligase adenylyltransferase
MGSELHLPDTSAPRAAADHSRFVQRIRRRYAADLPLLPPGLPDAEAITTLVGQLQAGGRALPSALRVARQLVLERLAVLDVEQAAPLDHITHTMTALAEATLEIALAAARAELDARHGVPRNAEGQDIDFWVLGMGKLGARELNVSSDIDLIYVYEEEGESDGRAAQRRTSTSASLAKRLYALIGEVTEDGFVFRMDLALRPNGNSGPPWSAWRAGEYFQVAGPRVGALCLAEEPGGGAARPGLADPRPPLRDVVSPFVYRRYLDYGVFEGLRQLHRKIRDEAQRRAAGRPERANDVKLSRGGIREIEFIVQLLQVVRGGQFPEIRTRSTLKALHKLAGRRADEARAARRLLAQAYVLLRAGRAPHPVPRRPADPPAADRRRRPALDRPTPGPVRLQRPPVACELLDRLCEIRELVANEFDALLHDGQGGATRSGCKGCGPGPQAWTAKGCWSACRPAWPKHPALREQPRVQALRDESKLRLGRLIQRTGQPVSTTATAPRPPPCASSTGSNPCCAATATWPCWPSARGAAPPAAPAGPGALADALPDAAPRRDRRTGGRTPAARALRPADFIAELDDRHRAWQRAGEDNEEPCSTPCAGPTMPRCSAPWCAMWKGDHRRAGGRRPVGAGRRHAATAHALGLAAPAPSTTGRCPRFAVIAYGKLGGKELGYGSDLDVVFLYDDADEPDPDRAQEAYGHFVRKLITWLTLRTARRRACSTSTPHCGPTATPACWSRSLSFERLPGGPRQQHRLDLGTPGHHPGALVRRPPALARAFRRGARSR